MCNVTYLEKYMTRTESATRSKHTRLFLSYGKSHNLVCQSTISRWVKKVMKKAGRDTQATQYQSGFYYSCLWLPQETIMAAAGWLAECTVATYYKKMSKKRLDLDNLYYTAPIIWYKCCLRTEVVINQMLLLWIFVQCFVSVRPNRPCDLKSHGTSNMQMRR